MTKFLGYSLAILIMIPIIIATLIVFVLIDGYTVKLIWNWIAVPGFGLKTMTVPMAIGAGFVVASFKPKMILTKSYSNEESLKMFRNYCIGTLFLLVSAFVVSKYFLV